MESAMKFLKFWLPVVAVSCGLTAAAYADCDCTYDSLHDELDERDIEAVIEFVNSKRTIDLQEKACNLAISGDIRTDWQHVNEKVNGERQRGGQADSCDGDPMGRNLFNVQFNLMFDYRCDRSWGVAHVEFKNRMGILQNDQKGSAPQQAKADTAETGESHVLPANSITQADNPACNQFANSYLFGSGQKSGINLKKAYWGYNISADGGSRFDIEVGRRRLYDVFDSRIQFLSQFDGVLLRYASQLDCADAYVTGGAFVVDERVNHWGGVVEGGILNLCDSGFDFKYSFIYWHKAGTNRGKVRDAIGSRFKNSQWTATYHLDPEVLCAPASIYGAILVNHAAKKIPGSNNKRNLGWYLGARVGEVCASGDWAIDFNWQSVQAQAIADPDVSGIGRGNAKDSTITANTGVRGSAASGNNPAIVADPSNARGDANYQGFKLMGLYGVTDNLSLEASIQWARQESKRVGGDLKYSDFKLEAIYAF